jgi:hypothetical protein
MDLFPLLEESARLLDRETDSSMLCDQLDRLKFVCDAVTDAELLDQVTDLINRYRKPLADHGSC